MAVRLVEARRQGLVFVGEFVDVMCGLRYIFIGKFCSGSAFV